MSKRANLDFDSAGLISVDDLYAPEDFDESLSYPAVVCVDQSKETP